MIGNVDRPEFVVLNPTIRPVTPIETGVVDLVIPDNLPQENLPSGRDVLPVVAIPTTELSDLTLVTISAFPPEEEILCT